MPLISSVIDDGVVGYYLPANASLHVHSPTLNAQVNGTFIQFDVVDFDSAGFVVGALPVDRLVVPSGFAGTYVIQAQLVTSASANNMKQGLILYVNGTVNIGRTTTLQQGTAGSSFNAVGIWSLKVGDYVQMQYLDQAGSASVYFTIDEPGTPSLSLARVGPLVSLPHVSH